MAEPDAGSVDDITGTYPPSVFDNAGWQPVGFADRPGLLSNRQTVCVNCGCADCTC